MRHLLTLALVFSLATPALAQRAEPIVLPSVRDGGQPLRYTLVRESQELAGGQVVQSIRATAPLTVRRESAPDGGARMLWAFGPLNVEVSGGTVGSKLGAGTAFGILDGMAFSYQDGEALQLLTPHAVRGAFLRAVRADEDRPGAFSNLGAVALREDFRSRIADPLALSDLVLDEPRLFHLLDGRRLTPGETVRDEAPRDSPLTGAPVQTTITTRLDSLSRDRRIAYVSWRAKADRDALIASLRTILERSAPGEVDPGFIADIAPTLLLEERATFAIDLPSGQLRSVDYTKTARVAGRERIDRTQFRAGIATPNAPAPEEGGG